MFNKKAIENLVEAYKYDKYRLKLINSCLRSFADYYKAVYELEIYKDIFYNPNGDDGEYRDRVTELDRSRTRFHNSLISNVSTLNRMAETAGTPLIYSGVVSEQQPYRRQIADSIFEFMNECVKNRS